MSAEQRDRRAGRDRQAAEPARWPALPQRAAPNATTPMASSTISSWRAGQRPAAPQTSPDQRERRAGQVAGDSATASRPRPARPGSTGRRGSRLPSRSSASTSRASSQRRGPARRAPTATSGTPSAARRSVHVAHARNANHAAGGHGGRRGRAGRAARGRTMPAAANIFGTCDCSVKPGIVLTSLSTRPSLGEEEVDPRDAGAAQGVEHRDARRPRAPCARRSSSGGRDPEVGAAVVLRRRVEEPVDHDLQRRRDDAAAVRAAEHGDVDLAAVDHVLDQHPVVERERGVEGRREARRLGRPG